MNQFDLQIAYDQRGERIGELMEQNEELQAKVEQLRNYDPLGLKSEIGAHKLKIKLLEAEVKRLQKKNALLQGDLKNAQACWHAACDDTERLDKQLMRWGKNQAPAPTDKVQDND